jgi:glycine C-acetyltransferase
MAYNALKGALTKELQNLKETGLFKEEKEILSPQDPIFEHPPVKRLRANNYLGLANHPKSLNR